jgi:hypothetical protein
MQNTPFWQLNKIKQILSQVEMENLVLAFSQAEGDQYLLAYVADEPPRITDPSCRALPLCELKSTDYAQYDGLAVGYSAIDVFFPDIPTHGVNFYSIEHVFHQQMKHEQWQRTSFHLAQALLKYSDGLSTDKREYLQRRAYIKIIQLALPCLLQENVVGGLVAILPDIDLHRYLDLSEKGYQCFYDAPLQENDLELLPQVSLKEDGQWVVALEELYAFRPELDWREPHFIDLPPILNQIHHDQTLKDTRSNLARRCWRQWETSHDRIFRSAAYALSAKAWFSAGDVSELVALLPHKDFERFVATGDALRIYRVTQPDIPFASLPGPRFSLESLINGQINESDYETLPLSFPALTPALEGISQHPSLDLGPLLWDAGQGPSVARTLWLLSRDLLNASDPSWLSIKSQSGVITDMAWRAASLYGLSNPWEWRQGRYDQFIEKCFNNLLICLLNDEQHAGDDPVKYYYRALREWYGCIATPDHKRSISDVVHTCKIFLEQSEASSKLPEERVTARRLMKIGERFTLPYRESEILLQETSEEPYPFDIPKYRRRLVDSHERVKKLSNLSEKCFQDFFRAHSRWRTLQETLRISRLNRDELDSIQKEIELQNRIVYAVPHALAVLHWAYNEDIRRIKQLESAVEIGPLIRVHVRNPWIVSGVRERVRIDVENIGGAPARELSLEIVPSDKYELASDSTVLRLNTVDPGTIQNLNVDIRTREKSSLTLTWSCTFRDHNDKPQVKQEEIPVDIIEPAKIAVSPKQNLYKAGLPVKGWTEFFGRGQQLRQILLGLISGITQPILLRGPRRMGKTSILNHLAWLLNSPNECARLGLSFEQQEKLRAIYTVTHSLQSVGDPALFFQNITEDICRELGVKYESNQELKEKAFRRDPTREFIKAMDAVFEWNKMVRILVIIDEWDELSRPEFSQLARNLRSVMEKEQRINWLISSTWTLSKEAGQYGSPFWNLTLPIELGELGWETAINLITTPSESMGVIWHGEAVIAVLEITGRRPYMIQLVCRQIVNYLMANRKSPTNIVDPETVAIVVDQFIKQGQATSQYIGFHWNGEDQESKVGYMGKLILWSLDEHDYPLTRAEIRKSITMEFEHRSLSPVDQVFFDKEFNAEITLLHLIFDVISRVGDRYLFSTPLIRRWIRWTISQQDDPVKELHTGIIHDWERMNNNV